MKRVLTRGGGVHRGLPVADSQRPPRRRGLFLSAAVVFLSLWVSRSVIADGDSTHVELEEILQRRSRQTETIRSARFKWDESQAIPRGGIHDPKHDSMPIPDMPKDRYLPPEDHYGSGVGTLLLEQDLIRFEITEELYDSSEKRFMPRKYVSSFDGRTNKVLRQPAGGAKQGSIYGKDAKQEKESIRLRPLMLALRPADPEFSRIPIESLEVLETPGFVRGRKCVRLRVPLPRGRQELYSVDPERDFCIVRYATELYGKLQSEAEAEYTKDEELWIPTTWTVQVHRYPDGFVQHVYAGTVTEYAINQPLGEGAFEVTFPEGTLMTDMRGGQPRSYVEDGAGSRTWPYMLGAMVVIFCVFVAWRVARAMRASAASS